MCLSPQSWDPESFKTAPASHRDGGHERSDTYSAGSVLRTEIYT